MAYGKNTKDFDDLDDFWELDAMLPPKATPPPRPADVETVEVSLGEKGSGTGMEHYGVSSCDTLPPTKDGASTSQSRKYPPITATHASRGAVKIDYSTWLQNRKDGSGRTSRIGSNDEVTVYVPENPLIFSVKVIRRCDFDNIEERSLSDMRMMADATAEFTENVEFTALYPQYSRMSDAQRRCYIGFRTEILNGRYPDVSESYILFFLYELLNLTDRYTPENAVDLLCSLMREYKGCSDALFNSMCDWLADLCLINRMNAPLEQLSEVRERVYKSATWKEFYVPFRADTPDPDVCILLTAASEYNYRNSKFYTVDTADYFEKHIPSAVGAALHHITSSEVAFNGMEKDVTTLSHEAYRNAFKSAKNRYTVSIDCACFTRSQLLRHSITVLVKYAENFVREMLGIRSRLSVDCLGTEKKEAIKEYFAPFIMREPDRPPLKRGRKKKLPDAPSVPAVPEYEKYYEPQSSGFSPELAAKIESDSWHTTDMLLTAFEDQTEEESPKFDTSPPQDAVNPRKTAVFEAPNTPHSAPCTTIPPLSPHSTAIEGLKLLLCGKSREFGAFAREKGLLPDTLAEQINQLALDTYGDIALEGDGSFGGFMIIEDYREELEELLQGN